MNASILFCNVVSILALGYACESGHTEVAEILINAGAPIDQPENEGRTPLMKAARAGHTCTVRYLIGKGQPSKHHHGRVHLADL